MTKRTVEPASTDFFSAHQAEVAAHPNSATAYVDKGWSHFSRGELGQATSAFEKAVSLDSQSIDAQYGLGVVAKAEGDNARARQAFERVLVLADSSTDVAKATMMRRMAHSAAGGL